MRITIIFLNLLIYLFFKKLESVIVIARHGSRNPYDKVNFYPKC